MSELIVISNLEINELFTEEVAKKFIEEATKKVERFEGDLTTKKGREAIASAAYSVSKLKTRVENHGISVVSEWKKKSAEVDKQRKYLKDSFDTLRDQVRQPLTEFEEEEKTRIFDLKCGIEQITERGMEVNEYDLDGLTSSLSVVEKFKLKKWDEFEAVAMDAIGKSVGQIELAIKERNELAAQQEELAALRAEKEERDKIDRENEIARKAKIEAENKAKIEAEAQVIINAENLARVEREKSQAIQQAKDAEEAVRKNAEKVAADLVKRQADDLAKEKAEIKAREDDLSHRKTVNNVIVNDLVNTGLDIEMAKRVVNAIFKGEISNVRINY